MIVFLSKSSAYLSLQKSEMHDKMVHARIMMHIIRRFMQQSVDEVLMYKYVDNADVQYTLRQQYGTKRVTEVI